MGDGLLSTTTYFKETDRNAYIPLTSFHYSQWLKAVPKGQFQRIRRNCTSLEDYHQQALVLKSRFLDKGYNETNIDDTIQTVGCLDRNQMLNGISKKKTMNTDNFFGFAMIIGYSNQHFSVKKILETLECFEKRQHFGFIHPRPTSGHFQRCTLFT